ncbi:hypothetical protein JG688_00015908 [Phytophthora aleatoria]|uniref:Uncharacterized protein n=1 Tax=Phytophthora aleatoria TaxID=2496075 RepID=A0A8J5IGZ2_9STRA|nr:hypothetical protein JG688_00015908 [Phytophthora aleatoria]
MWASSTGLSEEAFTAVKVEFALNKLFGDRLKKEITCSGDSPSVTRINHIKKDWVMRCYNTKKRKSDACGTQGQYIFY